jgi:hypothetical protein
MTTLITVNSSLGIFMCLDCGESEVDFNHFCTKEDEDIDEDN